MQEKRRYLQLSEGLTEKTQRMQEQFTELINSLAREHKLLHELAGRQAGGGKELLSKLPKELQEPISSVEEFTDALLKILRRTSCGDGLGLPQMVVRVQDSRQVLA